MSRLRLHIDLTPPPIAKEDWDFLLRVPSGLMLSNDLVTGVGRGPDTPRMRAFRELDRIGAEPRPTLQIGNWLGPWSLLSSSWPSFKAVLEGGGPENRIMTKSHRHQKLSPHEVKEPEDDEAYLSQTVPGHIGLGPHFSTHLLSLYLPTIPHCRQIRWPWALVDANGTVTAGVRWKHKNQWRRWMGGGGIIGLGTT
jgi:hypothetical protein